MDRCLSLAEENKRLRKELAELRKEKIDRESERSARLKAAMIFDEGPGRRLRHG